MYGGNIRRWVKRGILLGGGVLLLGIAKRSTVWAEQKQQEVRTFGLYWEGESLPYRRDSRTFYLPLTEEMKETGVKKAGFADCNGEPVSFVRLPETEELETAAAEGTAYPFSFSEGGNPCFLVFTDMPMLSVEETGAGDGDYTPVKVTLFSGMFSDGAVVHTEGRIKVRGALSTHFPKVGYRLKLEMTDEFGNRKKNPLSFLDMRVSDSWNLTALYADDLKIRDKVSIDLWQQLMAEEDAYGTEAAFGTNMEYVEVLRDGDYLGLYGLLEPIDARQLGISQSAGGAGQSEYYYKKQNDVIAEEAAFQFSVSEQILPETKTEEETENSVNYVASLEIKEAAGQLSKEVWEPIRQYMCMMRYGLFDDMAPELLNLTNTADFWIFLQSIGGVDNAVKNMYYAARFENGAYRLYFVPWDMDMSWGNEYCEESHTFQSYYTCPADAWIDWNPGTPMLEGHCAGFPELVKARYSKLRQDILSDENLISAMRTQFNYVKQSGAYARDAARWTSSPHTATTTQMETFARERMQALDEYIKEL